MPSNAFHLFHDTVAILESLSIFFTERKDVLAEMYQSAKVGVTAQEAKHIASF
jgi:dsDNA-binding SOS-regulon protein